MTAILYREEPAYDAYSVSLIITGSGTLDLAGELLLRFSVGWRDASIDASEAGNLVITLGGGDDAIDGGDGTDTV